MAFFLNWLILMAVKTEEDETYSHRFRPEKRGTLPWPIAQETLNVNLNVLPDPILMLMQTLCDATPKPLGRKSTC